MDLNNIMHYNNVICKYRIHTIVELEIIYTSNGECMKWLLVRYIRNVLETMNGTVCRLGR